MLESNKIFQSTILWNHLQIQQAGNETFRSFSLTKRWFEHSLNLVVAFIVCPKWHMYTYKNRQIRMVFASI